MRLCDTFGLFCPYATPSASLSSALKISENSDGPQPRPANLGCGCGCWSRYTENLVAVEDRG